NVRGAGIIIGITTVRVGFLVTQGPVVGIDVSIVANNRSAVTPLYSGWLAALLVVRKEVAIPGAHHQPRSRRPVGAESVNRQRVNRPIVRAQGVRIGRGAAVNLTVGAVRAAQGSFGPGICIIPAGKEVEGICQAIIHLRVSVVLDEVA